MLLSKKAIINNGSGNLFIGGLGGSAKFGFQRTSEPEGRRRSP